jgi:hypothetical protein
VPNFLKAGRQDVLVEAAEEFHRVQRHFSRAVRPYAAIGEGYLAIVAGHNPMVAYRDTEDIRCEISQRVLAISVNLRVHLPGALPGRRVDQVKQALTRQDVAELGAEQLGQGLHRDEEVSAQGQPATAVFVDPAPRHDVVHVRMVLQRPASSVQYPEEA